MARVWRAWVSARYESKIRRSTELTDQRLEVLQHSAKKQREAMIEQKASQVLRRWKNALLWRVFEGLREYAQTEKRHRHLCEKFVQTWKLRGARSCFNSWMELREERQLCRRVMQMLVRRWEHREVLAGWMRWRDWWHGAELSVLRYRCWAIGAELAS